MYKYFFVMGWQKTDHLADVFVGYFSNLLIYGFLICSVVMCGYLCYFASLTIKDIIITCMNLNYCTKSDYAKVLQKKYDNEIILGYNNKKYKFTVSNDLYLKVDTGEDFRCTVYSGYTKNGTLMNQYIKI